MLNKPIIQKWVDALRSGEFSQTQNRLGRMHEDGTMSYCCLGVLCEVAISDGLNIERTINEDYNDVEFNGRSGIPPEEVAYHAGLALEGMAPDDGADEAWMVPVTDAVQKFVEVERVDEYGEIYRPLHVTNNNMVGLADLNDSGNATFEEIADAIEAGLLR